MKKFLLLLFFISLGSSALAKGVYFEIFLVTQNPTQVAVKMEIETVWLTSEKNPSVKRVSSPYWFSNFKQLSEMGEDFGLKPDLYAARILIGNPLENEYQWTLVDPIIKNATIAGEPVQTGSLASCLKQKTCMPMGGLKMGEINGSPIYRYGIGF